MDLTLRIGTRGSPLALAQANQVRERLAVLHGLAREYITLEIIRTSGDMISDRPLARGRRQGIFHQGDRRGATRRQADLAVHSVKDLPTVLAPD